MNDLQQKQKPSTVLCQFIKNDNYLGKLMGKFNLMRNDATLCD
jgi:hypothetical protein